MELYVGADDKNSSVNILQVSIKPPSQLLNIEECDRNVHQFF